MALDSLRALYLRELQDLYSAEKQLVRALPAFARAAQSPELQAALKSHLGQTRTHVKRLEEALAVAGETADGARCKAMAALIKEGKDLLKQGGDPAVLDGALITAAQKIEHYEIAGYGSARTYANMLRMDEAADLLQQTLNEEGQADETLTELAEATLSVAASPDRLTDVAMASGREQAGGFEQSPVERPLATGAGLRDDAAEAGGAVPTWPTPGTRPSETDEGESFGPTV
jgi:ferritin-like metal-binding protein YciE